MLWNIQLKDTKVVLKSEVLSHGEGSDGMRFLVVTTATASSCGSRGGSYSSSAGGCGREDR